MVKGGKKVGKKISVTVPDEYLEVVRSAWDVIGVSMSEFISMNVRLFYHRLLDEGLKGSKDFEKIAKCYDEFMKGWRRE